MRSIALHLPLDGPCVYCDSGETHPRQPLGMRDNLPAEPAGRSFQSARGLRWTLMQRDGLMCHYCAEAAGVTIEHIVPKSLGGPLTEANTVLACEPCNNRRGNRNDPHPGCAFCARARELHPTEGRA